MSFNNGFAPPEGLVAPMTQAEADFCEAVECWMADFNEFDERRRELQDGATNLSQHFAALGPGHQGAAAHQRLQALFQRSEREWPIVPPGQGMEPGGDFELEFGRMETLAQGPSAGFSGYEDAAAAPGPMNAALPSLTPEEPMFAGFEPAPLGLSGVVSEELSGLSNPPAPPALSGYAPAPIASAFTTPAVPSVLPPSGHPTLALNPALTAAALPGVPPTGTTSTTTPASAPPSNQDLPEKYPTDGEGLALKCDRCGHLVRTVRDFHKHQRQRAKREDFKVILVCPRDEMVWYAEDRAQNQFSGEIVIAPGELERKIVPPPCGKQR